MIAGVILAAGSSSRLGRPKQLLDVGGQPLIRRTAERVLASSLDEVILVVGHEAEAVTAAVTGLTLRVVINPDCALGQSTSLLAGLKALSPNTEAVIFLLGDQPGLDPSVIDALITAWRASNAPVVAPRYREGIGNPVLFSARVFPELLSLRGDVGARSIVQEHQGAGDLDLVPVDQNAPKDVDSNEDYRVLVEQWNQAATKPGTKSPLPTHGETPPSTEGGLEGSRAG